MPNPSRMTVPRFVSSKRKGEKLAVLTAYDYMWAAMLDEAGVDAILVGDTLSHVVQGHSSTLPVTLEQMIYHGEMVTRAVNRALVIIDMPFMSFQVSPEQAVANGGKILKETTASAVKLEGGVNQAKTIEALTNADIPVMAHVGLKPQSIRMLGSMKIQRDEKRLLDDARAAQEAGAFAVVLELIPRQIAEVITSEIDIPTIGIGAGPHCDGQVLVSYDMLGMTDGFNPRFLKKFAELRKTITSATRTYVSEVHDGTYPDEEHSHE